MSFLKDLLTKDMLRTLIDRDLLIEGITKTTTVGKFNNKDFPELKGEVFTIHNKNEVVDALIELLGVPTDGTAIRIRTGFMAYDEDHKILFFSKTKFDLPSRLADKSKAAAEAAKKV